MALVGVHSHRLSLLQNSPAAQVLPQVPNGLHVLDPLTSQ